MNNSLQSVDRDVMASDSYAPFTEHILLFYALRSLCDALSKHQRTQLRSEFSTWANFYLSLCIKYGDYSD